MNADYIFESKRLGFRLWQPKDSVPFFNMNSNPEVMKYFLKPLSKSESNQFIQRIMAHFEKYHYGLWVVEIKKTREFIGFIGLYTATFESDFTPCTEIGWRLDKKYWHKGYATEGAKCCLEYGFNTLNLNQIYSFTAKINSPSISVMKRIGLKRINIFMHPSIDVNHPMCPHVLYGLSKDSI